MNEEKLEETAANSEILASQKKRGRAWIKNKKGKTSKENGEDKITIRDARRMPNS